MNSAMPVLMYHSVSECPPRSTHRLSVHPDAFDGQLKMLRRRGFTSLTFRDYAAIHERGGELPERAVVLTFDDGYADFHEKALPRLEAHGFTATVFVTTGWLDDAGPDAAGTPLDRMLNWRQLRDLTGAGIEIGAHSHSHPHLDQLPSPRLSTELRHSKDLLESGIDLPVETLAYPFGHFSRRVRAEVVSSGYRYAAAVANAVGDAQSDSLALPRLTVRRSTSPEVFERLISLRGIGRTFVFDRTLTAGFSAVRRVRYASNRLRGNV